MSAGISMREMLEAGVHFGHQTRRWNPHMQRYIFTARNGIHILDLAKTVRALDEAIEKVREVVSSGEQVLFVGTKKQARRIVEQEAERCGMPYISNRWLGGTLTNYTTIQPRIAYYQQLADRMGSGDAAFEEMTKRERMMLTKEFERLDRFYGGLRGLRRVPGLVFIVDPTMEENAVAEARRLGVPIVAMCDTNSNPDLIDYPIPSNDDAIRAIQLMTARVADAVLEGIAVGEVEQQFEAARSGDSAEDAASSAEPEAVAAVGSADAGGEAEAAGE
ncbi:MAG: 30S ribosomal protein S2 [Chloroflexi bacterium]|nr:30S ribosomal protein S2 [Chloroflexota bacterium]MQC48383.1 30S ribosomal protein S2 [Chloroflexota bacterium]